MCNALCTRIGCCCTNFDLKRPGTSSNNYNSGDARPAYIRRQLSAAATQHDAMRLDLHHNSVRQPLTDLGRGEEPESAGIQHEQLDVLKRPAALRLGSYDATETGSHHNSAGGPPQRGTQCRGGALATVVRGKRRGACSSSSASAPGSIGFTPWTRLQLQAL